jgi:CubicO group peptidase (beta-lactamase class C family)
MLALVQSVSAQAVGNTPRIARPDFSEARQLIRDWMARDSLPGLAIAIARGDSILWEEDSAGRIARRACPQRRTLLYLASVTKTITATAVMLLRERGRLDLDRAANSYLGASRLWSPAWDPAGATVRRLANHTSGLTTFDLDCAPAEPRCRLPSFAEIVRRYGVLAWRPGEHFDYSNLGYNVLGAVVAKAAGKDLGTFLREELYQPLGMMRSSLDVDPKFASETAVQYHWVYGPLAPGTPLASGASSAYASTHDLVLFGALHAKTHHAGKRALLSDAAIDTMQYAVVTSGTSRYGIGWWVEEDRFGYRTVLAQGGTPSSSAWLRVLPSEHIAVAVLANKGVGFPSDVIDAALAALLPRYAERRAAQLTKAATNAGPVAAPAPTPTQIDTAFTGQWKGIVRTVDGDREFNVAVSDSGTVLGTLGSRMRAGVGRARVANAMLRFTLQGDFVTADSAGGRRLPFYLRKRDGMLYGTVTTGMDASSGFYGRVSYWVELRKER